MPSATHSVIIARPIADVFAFVADGERAPMWRSGVLDIRRVSGEGAGTRYAQGVKGPMSRRIDADFEVTVVEPERRLEFQTISGPVRPHGRYDFEPSGAGTQVTFSLDVELSGVRSFLLGRAVQRTMEAEVGALERLKVVLESQASADEGEASPTV
jgi:carbon monoxide dehydrogenase subunit G